MIENEPLEADYWWRNIRNPVRFAEAAAALIADEFRIFVEIGPNPILHSYLKDGLRNAQAEGRVLATLSQNDAGIDPFPGIAALAYVSGYDWPSTPRFEGPANPRGLPLYLWDRQRFWFEKTVETAEILDPPFDHPLLGFRQRGLAPVWSNHLDQQVLPWIGDHVVEGLAIFPASAIIETTLAAARWRWPDAASLEAADVEMRRPLPFEKGRMRELRTALVSDDGDWELMSRPRLSDEPMTQHAVGRIAFGNRPPPPVYWPDNAATLNSIDKTSLYRLAATMGLHYGSRFRIVDRVDILDADRAIAHLDPTAIDEPLDSYLLHPALLDGALQGMLALLASTRQEAAEACFLPWRFERVRFAAPFGRACWRAQLRLTHIGIRSASADVSLFDERSEIVAELTGCWFRRVALNRRTTVGQCAFRVDLLAAPLGEGESPVVLEEAHRLLPQLAATLTPDQARHEDAALLEALIGAVGSQLWRPFHEPGRPLSIRELVEAGRISPPSAALAECLLRSVERLGGAFEINGEWRFAVEPDLPDAGEIWRSLLAEAADLVAELALVSAALQEVPTILADGLTPTSSTISAMRENLPQASPATVSGVNFLGEALAEISARWPVDRPLRILQIGGDAVVTGRLLQRLAKFPTTLAYLATSNDPAQVERLATVTQRYGGASGFPSDDAIGNTRFDILVVVNSCARLQIDAVSLAALHELIVPGGSFLAVEPEPNAVWDIVFGQSEDWWVRARSGCVVSPLRSREEWRAELTAAGFCADDGAELAIGPWPTSAFWASAPRRDKTAAAETMTRGAIVVIGEDVPLRRVLIDLLEGVGHRVVMAELSSDAEVLLAPGDTDGSTEVAIFLATEAAGASVAQQIAALARIAHAAAKRGAVLWLVTRDVHQAAPGAQNAGLAGAALWGFARVVANELPRLSIRMIDLATGTSTNSQARQIADEIAAATPETEIIWTPHGRRVPRLRPGLPPRLAAPDQRVKLAVSSADGLNSLGWVMQAPQAIGPGEIEIEVRAAGLNFRDVMWAMGLLPEEALIDGFAGSTFGLECAGIVCAIGADVEAVRVGDRVMGFAPEALGTRAVTIADAVAPIPAGVSFNAAATLPVAFVTVIYALGNLAQLEPGEHLLVHAAAGGIGLAAI